MSPGQEIFVNFSGRSQISLASIRWKPLLYKRTLTVSVTYLRRNPLMASAIIITPPLNEIATHFEFFQQS